nr:MAG TPA: DNA-directed RNA polymerase II subunit [Caudoviricetes sp.]
MFLRHYDSTAVYKCQHPKLNRKHHPTGAVLFSCLFSVSDAQFCPDCLLISIHAPFGGDTKQT